MCDQPLQGSGKPQAWIPRNSDPPTAARFVPVEVDPEYPGRKPRSGGLWTSTYDKRGGSGWVQWCLTESFDYGATDEGFPIWKLEVDPAARIYTIDSLADLERLVRAYPHRREWSWRGEPHVDRYPHWERIAEDFDGVHLTEAGQWATRLTHPLDLYGWDCESTLWFRWVFTSATDLGRVRYEEAVADAA